MNANHTPDCTYPEELTFKFRIPNDSAPDDILHISAEGITYERHYGNGHKWSDDYSTFKYCPICGTKYENKEQ